MTTEDFYLRERRQTLPHRVAGCKGQWEITGQPWYSDGGYFGELTDLRMVCRSCTVCHLVKAYKPGAGEDAPPVRVALEVAPQAYGEQPEAFPPIKVGDLMLVPTRVLRREPWGYEAVRGGDVVGVVSPASTPRGAVRWQCRALGQPRSETQHKTPRAAGRELAELLTGTAPRTTIPEVSDPLSHSNDPQ